MPWKELVTPLCHLCSSKAEYQFWDDKKNESIFLCYVHVISMRGWTNHIGTKLKDSEV